MKPYKHCPNRVYAAVILSASAGSVLASGFDLPDQDAFAVGRGLAVTATADNPSAIFYNPAGLTQLPSNDFEVGAYGISLQPQYKNPNTGATYGNNNPLSAIPQFFYSYNNTEHGFSLGLGVYAPSGLSSSFPNNTGFRTLGTQGSLEQIAINPVVAYKICDSLSIGAGLSANYANLDLRQGILWPNQPYDQFRFQGDGWGLAGNLGLMWQPIKQLSFGAALQSGTKINLNGYTSAYNSQATPLPTAPYYYPTFAVRTPAQADFQIPLKAEGGVSYRPTPKWNIEFDADYIDWESLGTVTIQQAAALPPLFPKDIPLVLDWQSSWYYELGVTRYLDCGWHVSAGYIFNENSVSSSHYLPIVADEDRHFFSVGLGHKGKQFDFDIAYQFGYGPDRTVAGNAPSAAGQTGDGTYSFISNAVAISVGWHF
ncbi:MAG: outer membrane protein transport protein [Verrucomicrobiota bacterium]|jgi:long-chain fatty acid transport protein